MLRESKEIEVSLDYGDFEGTVDYHKVKFAHSSFDSCFYDVCRWQRSADVQ